MKNQIKKRIQTCKTKLENLEKEWDRLDSQGMSAEQHNITRLIEHVQDEIKSLEKLLEFME